MAIGQSDGSIILTTEVDKSGIKKGIGSIKGMAKTATKAFLAVGAAAATATIAIAKASVDAFAEYEQLVGGVETLFKGSSKKLIEYANEAFRTSGLSANEFMSTVTSFSASLISSLGGDTEKAADIANKALIDMSDNANKMGTSLERIQMAYQSFARGQYQLLDNLALGYGGTKSEMERLLKDAQAITGVKYDISNLADVYTAIGVIQEKLGIAGTTAKEAATTISGSAATMRAAWQNVLTAISGGGDLDNAINNLVDSISVYFENIVPVVERSMIGIGALIEKVAPMLVQTVAKSLIKAIPSLLNAVYEMIIGLAKGVYQGIVDLFNGTSRDVLTEQAENIEKSVENQNELTKAVEETNEATKRTLAGFDDIQILSSGMADDASENTFIPESTPGGIGEIIETEKAERELSDFEKALKKSFEKISKIIKKAWDSEPVQSFWDAVVSAGELGLNAFKTIGGYVSYEVKEVWNDVKDDFKSLTDYIVGIWNGFWSSVSYLIDVWGPTTVENVGQFAKNIISLFKSIYDNVLKPIIEPLLSTMVSLWNDHISQMIEKVFEFVLKLKNGAMEIYNKFIHPIVTWFLQTVEPTFVWIGNVISSFLGTIIATVSDVAGGIFKSLGGLIDFIAGVFTGDWKQAWNGIKSFFVGIWDSIWASIKNTINIIIDGLNALWGGLYRSLSTIINGVGGIVDGIGKLTGKDWGWSIPTNPPMIPKLAKGAVIPPNKEFLAVLGDQKHGTNIEAPLSTIQDAVQMVVSGQMEEMNALLSSSISVQREILEAVLGIEIGDDVIGNAVSRYQRKMTVIHGG